MHAHTFNFSYLHRHIHLCNTNMKNYYTIIAYGAWENWMPVIITFYYDIIIIYSGIVVYFMDCIVYLIQLMYNCVYSVFVNTLTSFILLPCRPPPLQPSCTMWFTCMGLVCMQLCRMGTRQPMDLWLHST